MTNIPIITTLTQYETNTLYNMPPQTTVSVGSAADATLYGLVTFGYTERGKVTNGNVTYQITTAGRYAQRYLKYGPTDNELTRRYLIARTVYTPQTYTLRKHSTEYQGYRTGDTWDGHDCPVFTLSIAKQILVNAENDGWIWSYDESLETFHYRHQNTPENHGTQTRGHRNHLANKWQAPLFAIGANQWPWLTVNTNVSPSH